MSAQEKLMKEAPAHEIITRGRLEMVYKGNFFSELVLGIEPLLVKDDDPMSQRIWSGQKPTMATDGKKLFVAESFLRTLTFKQMLFVFVHEGLHYGLGHPLRLRGYNRDIMNICADVIVNQMCLDSAAVCGLETPPDIVSIEQVHQFFHIPAGVSYKDLPYKYSCEELYQLFVKKSGESGDGVPKPKWGYIIEQEGPNGEELTESEIEQGKIKQQIELAAAAERANARKPGSVPGSIQEQLDRMRKAQVNWRKHLANFMTGGRPKKYSWMRLNKRFRHIVKLPHLKKEAFGKIVIFIDTSGSVCDKSLQQFLGEINAISQMANYEEIITVPVDYIVHEKGIMRFKSGEHITHMRVDGRGGTSFIPAFEWLDNHPEIKPFRVIYMTDMEGAFPPKPCKYPTMWLATTNIKAPWGTTIPITV